MLSLYVYTSISMIQSHCWPPFSVESSCHIKIPDYPDNPFDKTSQDKFVIIAGSQ